MGVIRPSLNPAQPGPGVELCRMDEIDDPGSKGFDFREGDAWFGGFLVRVGERINGYVDSCPHAGWPLGSAPDQYLTRDKDRILCAGHGMAFAIDTGACVVGPESLCLTPWLVEVGMDGVVRTA